MKDLALYMTAGGLFAFLLAFVLTYVLIRADRRGKW